MQLIFKMITEKKDKLDLLQLMRQYVSTPPNSTFAQELTILLQFFIKEDLMIRRSVEVESRFQVEFLDFLELVNYSCLIPELVNKFVIAPHLAFSENGEPNEEYWNISEKEMERRRFSVCIKNSRGKTVEIDQDERSKAIWNSVREEVKYEVLKNSQSGETLESDKEIRKETTLFKQKIIQPNYESIMAELVI